MRVDKIIIRGNQEEEIKDLTTAYPYAYHNLDLSKVSVPWHWHEEVEFCYVRKGSLNVTTIDQQYIFQEKEAFFINSKVICSMSAGKDEEEVQLDSHIFHSVFLSGHYKSVFEIKYIMPIIQNKNISILAFKNDASEDREIIKRMNLVSKIQTQNDTEIYTRNYFSEIWLWMMRKIEKMPQKKSYANTRNQERMQIMMSYIHRNYSEKITLEDIAGEALISPRECIRCFQNSIMKSPIEYLMDYRLEVAKKLLKESESTITEIGLQVGFSSNAYFGKVFRERVGMTPAKYRKKI